MKKNVSHRKIFAVLIAVLILISALPIASVSANFMSEDGYEYVLYSDDAWIVGYRGDETELVIPEKIDGYIVEGIGDHAFMGHGNIVKFDIPDTVTSIGSNAFTNSGYYNNEDNWDNDVLYVDNALVATRESEATCDEVKEGTTIIARGAYNNFRMLESISIPAGAIVCHQAFEGCSYLSDINIDSKVKQVERTSFQGTKYFETESNWEDGLIYAGPVLLCADGGISEDVVIKEGTTVIANSAFESLSNKLFSVHLPESLSRIGDKAFLDASVKELYIPGGITYIGELVYDYLDGDILFGGSKEKLDELLFTNDKYGQCIADNNEGLVNARIHYNVTAEHLREAEIIKPAQCLINGTSKCSCGYVYEGAIPAIGHNFVDGVCTNCGNGEVVKLYFENSENWESVYACAWTWNTDKNEADLLFGYPGLLCTDEGNGVFSVEIPNEEVTILFNDNGSHNCEMQNPGSTMIAKKDGTYKWFEYNTEPSTATETTETTVVTETTEETTSTTVVTDSTEGTTVVTDPTEEATTEAVVTEPTEEITTTTVVTEPTEETIVTKPAETKPSETTPPATEETKPSDTTSPDTDATEPSKPANVIVDDKTQITVETEKDAEVELKVVEIANEEKIEEIDLLLVGEKTVKVFDITLVSDGVEVQPDGKVTVRIPVGNVNSKIYRMEADGTLTDMNAVYKDGYLEFTTEHFSLYVVAEPESDNTKPSEPVVDKGILGDVNGDGKVNIKDATMIQKAAAKILSLTEDESIRANVNGDKKVNVKDATAIQKFVAKIETGYPISKPII